MVQRIEDEKSLFYQRLFKNDGLLVILLNNNDASQFLMHCLKNWAECLGKFTKLRKLDGAWIAPPSLPESVEWASVFPCLSELNLREVPVDMWDVLHAMEYVSCFAFVHF